MKRHNEGSGDRQAHTKKHKQEHHRYPAFGSHNSQHVKSKNNDYTSSQSTSEHNHPYEDPTARLPPPVSQPGAVPSYTSFTVSRDAPPLPPINDDNLTAAPFTHRSMLSSYNRGPQTTSEVTYESLEFLGDAYIELIASRLLHYRYGHLTAGQKSQLRELLVKNETLSDFSRLYGFHAKVKVDDFEGMAHSTKGNKGFNKILGDVFEAYVAAVVLSDVEEGFAIAEKWLTRLWVPKLEEAARNDATYVALTHSNASDPKTVYNPAAKSELQQRIVDHQVTKLEYEAWKPPLELKGDQLGQNRHFIALYLTGYGYERKLLAKGEGRNKVEAGNWAAIEAMHGEAKGVVEECEQKLNAVKTERKKAAAAKKAKKDE